MLFSRLLEELSDYNRQQFYLDIQEKDGDETDPVTGVFGLMDDAVYLILGDIIPIG